MTRYRFDPSASRLEIHASSSVHPIDTDADGVTGELVLQLADDGSIDLDAPVTGALQFELRRLASGNPLYDRETERRIEARKYPLVEATLTTIELIDEPSVELDEAGSRAHRYRVQGELTFHGVTQKLDGELSLRSMANTDPGDESVDSNRTGSGLQFWGEHTIDVRHWKIKPPRLGLLKVHPEVRVHIDITAHGIAS